MLRWAGQQEARDPEWRQQYRTDARRPLGEKEVYGGRTTMNNNNEQQWTTMNNNEQQSIIERMVSLRECHTK